MRHFFVARPVATLSRGMPPPSRRPILVALSGALKRPPPGPIGAVSGAIDLAAVTAATDQRLGVAAGAQKQPSWRGVGVIETAIATWTTATIAGILSLHACPAPCRARRRCGTAKLRSAPCLPSKAANYYAPPAPAVSPATDQRNSNISSASAARLRPLCLPGPTLAKATRPASRAG
jgi:hypothetical protein